MLNSQVPKRWGFKWCKTAIFIFFNYYYYTSFVLISRDLFQVLSSLIVVTAFPKSKASAYYYRTELFSSVCRVSSTFLQKSPCISQDVHVQNVILHHTAIHKNNACKKLSI